MKAYLNHIVPHEIRKRGRRRIEAAVLCRLWSQWLSYIFYESLKRQKRLLIGKEIGHCRFSYRVVFVRCNKCLGFSACSTSVQSRNTHWCDRAREIVSSKEEYKPPEGISDFMRIVTRLYAELGTKIGNLACVCSQHMFSFFFDPIRIAFPERL